MATKHATERWSGRVTAPVTVPDALGCMNHAMKMCQDKVGLSQVYRLRIIQRRTT